MSNTAEKHDVYQAENTIRNILSEGYSSVSLDGKTFSLPRSTNFVTKSEAETFHRNLHFSPYITMRYGVIPKTTLLFKNNLTAKSYYSPSTHEIHLSTGDYFTNKLTILHEYAHHIVHVKNMNIVHHHDKTFIDVYKNLLNDILDGNLGDVFEYLVEK